ncbi:hypothetical protein FQN54_008692 [Arachnomyces sp. PD_36]|nr:hypothetical protein FQN54_008692 [Arachnomyces sp. PD_36]
MSLCNFCQGIPFDSLPTPEEPYGSSLIADNSELIQFWWGLDDPLYELKDPLGFPWHEDLNALEASAGSGCPLCSLVQKGAQSWIEKHREPGKGALFWREFHQKTEPIPHGQRLWLTRRFGGGDGFTILVRNPNLKNAVHLLTGVAFCVGSNDPLAPRFPLRPIEPDSGSRQSLDVAASWLNHCVEKHERCTSVDAALPSRLLDVGTSDDSVIKLINCAPNLRSKYVSLSYCWGRSSTATTTTRDSYSARTSGIPMSDLPRTLQDAITITRHFDIRYLWVDSLCILQDNQNDWARESARMADVFSNAWVVLAANRARDSGEGCFHNRVPRASSIVNIPGTGEVYAQLLFPSDEWDSARGFDSEPLTQRGWAFQERALARRTLHYNTRQMYFECNHGVRGEDGCSVDKRFCRLGPLEQRPWPREKWYELLFSYGDRLLSKPTDRLPAVSGLAKMFDTRSEVQYVAGLWSDTLIEGLAWQSMGDRAPASTTDYVGPSWSWASHRGSVSAGRQKEWQDVARVESWHVDLKNKENPYGEVEAAWIRIRAPMALLKPSEKIREGDIRRERIGMAPLRRMCTPYSDNEMGSRVVFDDEQADMSGEWRHWDMYVLVLGGNTEPLANPSNESTGSRPLSHGFGLVLIDAESAQGPSMERVGWMDLGGEEAVKMKNDEACWRTVVLV